MALVKVATYEGNDFYDKICKYASNWLCMATGRPDVDKFALLQNIDGSKVFLTVSQNHYREPNMSYNCIFHSGSKNSLVAKQVLDDFIKKTGFEVRDAPPDVEKTFDALDAIIDCTPG